MKEQLRGPASLLLEEVSSVRGELAKAEESLQMAQERFLRLNADFDNYRKRTVGWHAPAAACCFITDSMCAGTSPSYIATAYSTVGSCELTQQ